LKILALNGSHRGSAGYTQRLLDYIAKGAQAAGAEFETVILAQKRITPCCGKDACHQDGKLSSCVYEHQDDVKAIFEQMKAADILIYATPVYIFNVSGLMKNFLDRLNSTAGGGGMRLTNSGLFFHAVDKDLHSKPFVMLTLCGNVEDETTKTVVSYFKTFSRFLDAPIVGTLVRKSVGMLDDNIAGTSKKAVDAVVQAYVQAGHELASRGIITTATERKASQPLLNIPFFDILMKFRWFKKMAIARNQPSNKQ
jgi:multimeric flavodoxin WrbA